MSTAQQKQVADAQDNDTRQEGEQLTRPSETRVNIAEEFYLKVTARPDVRELLRRLAKM